MYKSGIFTPATRLLQLMPIASKFFVMLLVFIIPLAYLSWNSIEEKEQQLDFFQTQSDGLVHLNTAYQMLPKIMLLRDTDYASKFGFINDNNDVDPLISDISLSLQQLSGRGTAGTQEQLAEVTRLWHARQRERSSALERHNHFSMLTLAMRQYLQRLAEEHDILLGRDLHAYQLSHIYVDTMVYTLDLVSALRGLGVGIISRGNFTPDSFIKISYYAGELEKTLNTLRRSYKASDKTKMNDSMLYNNADKVLLNNAEFLAITREQIIDPDRFNISAHAYHQQANEVLHALQSLRLQTDMALRQRLDANIAKQQWQKNEIIIISSMISLLMLYLFIGFYYAMKQGIHQINITLSAIAKGDFSQRAEPHGRDEIRNIADNLNHTADQINKLVKIAYS